MAQRFIGAGAIGGLVNAGGMSAIESASTGKDWRSEYLLFVGPLSIDLQKGMKPQFGLSSISSLYYLGDAILDPNARFSFKDTLNSGTPVFHGSRHLKPGAPGRTMGNVVFLGSGGHNIRTNISRRQQYILGHERIHAMVQHRMGAGVFPLLPDLNHLITNQMGGVHYGNQVVNQPILGEFEDMANSFPVYGR